MKLFEVEQQVDSLQHLDRLLRLAAVQVVDEDEDPADDLFVGSLLVVQALLERLEVVLDLVHVRDLAAVVARR